MYIFLLDNPIKYTETRAIITVHLTYNSCLKSRNYGQSEPIKIRPAIEFIDSFNPIVPSVI